MIGLLGNAGIYAPLLVYVSRWFERRRGAAIALVSSGQYVAGVVWPFFFERGFALIGWQAVMLCYAALVAALILPVTRLLKTPPAFGEATPGAAAMSPRHRGHASLKPNVMQALICLAAFCCCIPMAVPSAHIVAFCGDIGIKPTHGAAMLSVMLGCAFLSRQAWGALADRIGGLRTVMAGSLCQALAIAGFLATQDEAGLFAVSAAFGLGFSGIIPAYSVAIRDHFRSAEASWRIPLTLFTAMSGMAFGSWLAGALYDRFGYYAPAFGTGVAFNLANLVLVGFLLLTLSRPGPRKALAV
jgi:MFS family permease